MAFSVDDAVRLLGDTEDTVSEVDFSGNLASGVHTSLNPTTTVLQDAESGVASPGVEGVVRATHSWLGGEFRYVVQWDTSEKYSFLLEGQLELAT